MREITVEFYGVAQRRTGTSIASVRLDAGNPRLADVVADLDGRFPQLALHDGVSNELARDWVANFDGDRFVRRLEEPLGATRTVLILSADSGG